MDIVAFVVSDLKLLSLAKNFHYSQFQLSEIAAKGKVVFVHKGLNTIIQNLINNALA